MSTFSAAVRYVTAAMLAAVSALAPARAVADDSLAALRGMLDEPVIMTASQKGETAETAPATSSVLTADDLHRYGIRSLDEAINYLSLGAVATDPLNTAEVGARGVLLTRDNGRHFLILVDGHHLNEPLFGAARVDRGLGVPFELIDHIEVILGAGSVLYGSNAMLGVINVVTKRAKDFSGVHLVAESEIAKSYRAAAGTGATFDLLGAAAEGTLQLEYYRRTGPVFTLGPQNAGIDSISNLPIRTSRTDPGTGIWGGQTKHGNIADAPSAYGRLRVGNFQASVNASLFKRGKPTSPYDFDEPQTFDIDRRLWGDLSYETALGRNVRLRLRAYGDSFDYQNFVVTSQRSLCPWQVDIVCRYNFAGASRWGGLEPQLSFDWYQDGRLVTLVGADGRLNYYGYKRDSSEYGTGVPLGPSNDATHGYDERLGVYAQNVWHPHAAVDLNVGARIDVRAHYESAVNPRTALNLRPWDGGTLKLIYAEAFRAPTYVEVNEAFGIQAHAPDLRPEKVASFETSLEQRFGAQKLLFGVFRSRWRDLVQKHVLTRAETDEAFATGNLSVNRDAGLVSQHRNTASVLNYGFNAMFEGSLVEGRLRYGAAFTGAYARQSDRLTGAVLPLQVAPQALGNARVSYDLQGSWPTLALVARYVGPSPADAAFTFPFQPTPYVSGAVSFRTTASGPVPFVRGLSYRVSAELAPWSVSPYIAGPNQTPRPDAPSAELTPVDPFRVGVGVYYDF